MVFGRNGGHGFFPPIPRTCKFIVAISTLLVDVTKAHFCAPVDHHPFVPRNYTYICPGMSESAAPKNFETRFLGEDTTPSAKKGPTSSGHAFPAFLRNAFASGSTRDGCPEPPGDVNAVFQVSPPASGTGKPKRWNTRRMRSRTPRTFDRNVAAPAGTPGRTSSITFVERSPHRDTTPEPSSTDARSNNIRSKRGWACCVMC
jgi:hypothetical protein